MSNNNALQRRALTSRIDNDHGNTSMEPLSPHESQPRQSNGISHGICRRQQSDRTLQTTPAQKILIKRSIMALSLKEVCLHALSIACSVVIVSLCAKEVYFKDIDAYNINAQLNAFQFMSALHGALVALSLGAMAVDHMLHELCQKEGLPLGHMILPFQLSSVLIPIRTKFWIATFSNTTTVRKIVFGTSIVIAVILQALIGPSSAILVVPQLEFWDYRNPFGSTDGFTFFNQSHDFMWPSYINASLVPSDCDEPGVLMREQCPYANLAQIRSWGADYRDQFSGSNITSVSDGNQLRYISSSDIDDRDSGYSASTTIMAHIARDFGNIWSYAGRHDTIPFGTFRRPKLFLLPTRYDKQIMRPIVQAECAAPIDITNSTNENLMVVFPGDRLRGAVNETFNSVTVTVNATHFRERPVVADFIDLSAEGGRPASGVIFGLHFIHANLVLGQNFSSDNGTGLIACSITAHWIPTNLTSDPTTSNIVTMDSPDPNAAADNPELMSQSIPLRFDPAYLNKVNSKVQGNNANVLEYNTRGLAVRGSHYQSYDGAWNLRWRWILSTITTVQLSDALSRINLDSRMEVFCQGCAQGNPGPNNNEIQDLFAQNIPENTHLEPRTAPELKADIIRQPERFVPVQWRVQRYGYGWGLNHVTKWLAIATVVVHAVLVLAHTVLSMIRRTRFEAWSDFPEFLALVNQSPAMDFLRDLGVGVVEDGRFAENVAIRVLVSKDGERGEHTRAALTASTDLEKIEAGKKYD